MANQVCTGKGLGSRAEDLGFQGLGWILPHPSSSWIILIA